MFYLYLQSSSSSRHPKISNLMFFANPVYRAWSHPNAWHLKTFQWHGWTRSTNNSILLSEIYQFFVGKYSIFIYNPQALLESEKIPTLPFRWPCTQSAKRSKRDTKKFSLESEKIWTSFSPTLSTKNKIFLRILPDKIQNTVRKL